jgi:uncharacterized protein YlxW (UPF0749 family)
MSQDDQGGVDATHDTGSSGPHEPGPRASSHPLSRARRIRSSLTVVLVLALSGLMFTASARLARDEEGRHPQNLTELVQSEDRRVESMTQKVVDLEAEVASLAQNFGPTEVVPPADAVNTGIVDGSIPVSGPGISVTLDDAPPSQQSRSANVDNLVVHQQDLQDVINALWAGGAEAMTLQGQRVTPTTGVRCVGNVLNLHGRVYSPPYTVSAIGDPAELQAALDRSAPIDLYLDYVDAYGLGWKVDKSTSMDIPAFEGTTDLQYATVASSQDGA